jgi:N-methylhydantoinase A
VRLRPELAEQAIRSRIAEPLGMDVIEAASGIHRIVCEHMASAARIHAMEKGRDIRGYALLAFGGAGPIHAREVARRSGCREILVPAHAGVFSAVGLLGAPVKLDMVRTRYAALAGLDLGAIEDLYAEMARSLRAEMQSADVPAAAIKFRRSADMRYVGQGFEVNARLPEKLAQAGADGVAERFHAAYEQQYGRRLADQAIEALNWRLEAIASVDWPEMAWRPESPVRPAPARSRPAYFPELGRFVDTRVIAEGELADGASRDGPALVEQPGSTLVAGPGDRFAMDRDGNIRMALGEA